MATDKSVYELTPEGEASIRVAGDRQHIKACQTWEAEYRCLPISEKKPARQFVPSIQGHQGPLFEMNEATAAGRVPSWFGISHLRTGMQVSRMQDLLINPIHAMHELFSRFPANFQQPLQSSHSTFCPSVVFLNCFFHHPSNRDRRPFGE